MLVLFLVLLIAPLIARNLGVVNLDDIAGSNDLLKELLQPLDKNNNDTMSSYTGSGIPKGMEPVASPGTYKFL